MADYSMSDSEDGRPSLVAPEPVRPWAAALGRGLSAVHEFASEPFGYKNPPGRAISEFIGVPQAGKIMEDVGYGTTHMTDNTARGREWRMEAAESLPILAPAAKAAARGAWSVAGKVPRAPHGQVQMFINPGPREQSMLFKAQDLEASGASPEKIWADTGMLRWLDGSWRHEVNDSDAAFKAMDYLKETRKRSSDRLDTINQAKRIRDLMDSGATLDNAVRSLRTEGIEVNKVAQHYAKNHSYEELLDKYGVARNEFLRPIDQTPISNVLEHEELFSQMPGLKRLRFRSAEMPEENFGAFYPGGPGVVELSTELMPRRVKGRGTTLHEVQHAHDFMLGHDYGSSPAYIKKLAGDQGIKLSDEEAHAIYSRVSGEALARLTENRMPLSAANRRQVYPLSRGPYGIDVNPAEVRTMEDIYKRGVQPYNAPSRKE